MTTFNLNGFEELQRAIARNPERVVMETSKFLARGLAVYRRIIFNNPWKLGDSGGGAPVDTGNLRQTHAQEIGTWEARIYPTAKYAPYIHGIEGWARTRSYQLRPWLDYARKEGDPQIHTLEVALLDNVVANLAR